MNFQGRFVRAGVVTATMAAALATAALTSGNASAAQSPNTMSPAARCGATLNPSTGSAHAHWDVTCKNGEVTISGYVQHDGGGGCAYVKAVFEGQITEKSAESCGFWGGPQKSFKWTHPGSIADAYLTET
jgi:invasion protein IalB